MAVDGLRAKAEVARPGINQVASPPQTAALVRRWVRGVPQHEESADWPTIRALEQPTPDDTGPHMRNVFIGV